MKMKDRVAFVSGGSGGLGSAIAKALAAAGTDICFGYIENLDSAQETVRDVEALGRRATAVQIDQADPASIDAAIEEAVEQLGRMDSRSGGVNASTCHLKTHDKHSRRLGSSGVFLSRRQCYRTGACN